MLFISLLIVSCLAGNGLNVQDQLLLTPYPKSVTAAFLDPLSIALTPKISMNLPDLCQNDEGCLKFMKFNFNHTITYPLQRQMNIEDFRVSQFEAIDLPRITPNIASSAIAISIDFTGKTIAEVYPKLAIGIDESYTLNVDTDGITISAATVYGARHALETLIQLCRPYNGKFVIGQLPIHIEDAPRYRWRGLMVDPSRNVLSRPIFFRIVDALASLKCNILHIHVSDAQTFMYESKKYPQLHKKGAYDQKKVLTQSFISQLVKYGAMRGVIVYPELDTPAHTASWNLGYPGVVADCWDYIRNSKMRYGENVLTLNPTSENTFPIIEAVLKELGDNFGSDFVHIGGDEVWTGCWKNSKEYAQIQEWMAGKNISSLQGLEAYFNKYAQQQVINNGKKAIVWEEVYQKGSADKSTIVQVWNDIRLLKQVLDDGYKAFYSAGFYLDMQMPLCSEFVENSCTNPHHMWVWTNRDMYSNDPALDLTEKELDNLLGGEGCSWGESTDDQNFFDRVFQRFSAIAERLWSMSYVTDPESHEVRANYLRCLGVRRNIMKGTGPLYHSRCQLPEDL